MKGHENIKKNIGYPHLIPCSEVTVKMMEVPGWVVKVATTGEGAPICRKHVSLRASKNIESSI